MAKKSISNAHFLVFLSRQCQNVENVHETFISTKIPFKRRTFLDHRVQKVPHVSSETSLPRLVQNKPSALIRREENKVKFLETWFHSEKLSFVHKKESEQFFELFLSICVFHRGIFKLKMQNFGLENHHMMSSTKVQNLLLPHRLCGWPFDLSEGGAYGWFSLGKNVFPKPLKLEIFSRHITL